MICGAYFLDGEGLMLALYQKDPEKLLQYQILRNLFKLQYPTKIKRYHKRLLTPKNYEDIFKKQQSFKR